MSVSRLSKGMVIKNYHELCELLGVEVKTSNSKVAQLKELERYIRYSKDKNKFIVEEVYSTPIPKNNPKYYIVEHYSDLCTYIVDTYGLDVNKLTRSSRLIIQWKCESCNCLFDGIIINMIRKGNSICKKCIRSTYDKKIYEILEYYGIPFDIEITFDDLKFIQHLRFDYGVYNTKGELIGLIEYDGQYHDISIDISVNDTLKDNYCSVNNIPLLRIHHTEHKDLDVKLLLFLRTLHKYNTMINMELIRLKGKLIKYNKRLMGKIDDIKCKVDSNNKYIADIDSE